MEIMSLHPLDDRVLRRFVDAVQGDVPPDELWTGWWPSEPSAILTRMRDGDERAANEITLRLAYALGAVHPTFAAPGFGLTLWEARVDRGVGMYLRPPARMFRELGMSLDLLRDMPIRVDMSLGLMGGAYIPAHLIPNVRDLLDSREQRMARRLREADYDPVVALSLFQEAVVYADENKLGLFEALDAVGPEGQAVFGGSVIIGSRNRVPKEERKRIDEMARPPREPGLLRRVFGKSASVRSNGHQPLDGSA